MYTYVYRCFYAKTFLDIYPTYSTVYLHGSENLIQICPVELESLRTDMQKVNQKLPIRWV